MKSVFRGPMAPWHEVTVDKKKLAAEREKARKLRASQWWKNRIAAGLCHYCGKKFKPAELTMDHIVPVARGGTSTKGNIVPSCKACNRSKKLETPVEQLLDSLSSGKVDEND